MVLDVSMCSSAESSCKKDAEAHSIGDGVFLGSVKAATNIKTLESWKITRILVVDTTSSILWPDKFSYKRVKLEDIPTANLLAILPEALAFLGEAQLRRDPVLVHCTRGFSRSASVAIAFQMLFKGLSYEDALNLVKRRRPNVYPNIGFQQQLQQLDSMKTRCLTGHWGKTMNWLRSAVPQGDLTLPTSAFNVHEAIHRAIKSQLDQVEALVQATLTDCTLLQQRSPWKPHGLFFEYLHKYKTIIKDMTLLSTAVSISRQLKNLREVASHDLLGVQAAVALAGEVDSWIEIVAPLAEGTPTMENSQIVTCKPKLNMSLVDSSYNDDDDEKDNNTPESVGFERDTSNEHAIKAKRQRVV